MNYNILSYEDKKEIADLYLRKLELRFNTKIEPEKYYLSYSGGKDSHLLYWFIKRKLRNDSIKIIGVNTRMEHDEIRERIYKYCDEVLLPSKTMHQIKEQYGIPCFTKTQDEFIKRYQRGCRTDYILKKIFGTQKSKFGLSMRAKKAVLSDDCHYITNECCKYTKHKPLEKYERRTKRKPIIATRGDESNQRKNAYRTCLTTKGKFTPMYDFPDEAVRAIYEVYADDLLYIPEIYKFLSRTGCAGCPYGHCIEKELSLLSDVKRRYVIDVFKESYDIKGVNYQRLEKESEDYFEEQYIDPYDGSIKTSICGFVPDQELY